MAQRQCTRLAISASTCWRTATRIEAAQSHPQTGRHTRGFNSILQRQNLSSSSVIQQQRFPLPLKAKRQPRLNRPFTTTPSPQHGDLTPPAPGQERHVTFIDKDGSSHTFTVSDGDNLLDIAQAHDLEMEGACGGSCACSTCHVIVGGEDGEAMYDKMEEPSDDENDMLDLAFGLTETSRLGCQVEMRRELDGLVVKLPSMTRNMQASDFAEKEKKA